jgi:N-acetylneuraminic acid mutarotase
MLKRRMFLMLVICCALATSAAGCATGADGTWNKLAPVGEVPSARWGQAWAYDSTRDQVLLFAGRSDQGIVNDTWAYDPTTNGWADLKPTGDLPGARAGHSMVYDPHSGKIILFGGYHEFTRFNDTWAYDPATNAWTDLKPTGDLPCARFYHSMVYDPGTGRMLLFGGTDAKATNLNDTWAYDPAANTWNELAPACDLPSARGCCSMAYDPNSAKMILFGGDDDGKRFRDTWAYDSATNKWSDLKPTGDLPAPRCSCSMVYDPSRGKMILFGGFPGERGWLFNDTWAYDPIAREWVELHPAGHRPDKRSDYSMVYDPLRGGIILFGGSAVPGYRNDLWVLSMKPAAAPSDR